MLPVIERNRIVEKHTNTLPANLGTKAYRLDQINFPAASVYNREATRKRLFNSATHWIYLITPRTKSTVA